jgi:hypothetical protein
MGAEPLETDDFDIADVGSDAALGDWVTAFGPSCALLEQGQPEAALRALRTMGSLPRAAADELAAEGEGPNGLRALCGARTEVLELCRRLQSEGPAAVIPNWAESSPRAREALLKSYGHACPRTNAGAK